MNKSKLTKFITDLRVAVDKHSPEILTGIGIAGMITTTILAVKATPKAIRLIEAAEKDKYDEVVGDGMSAGREPLTAMETVKVAWKPYIPAVVTGMLATGCLIGGNSIHARRNAALATAYQLSSTALKEYKAKVVETIGEKKEEKIRDSIAKDKLEKNITNEQTVLITGSGHTKCYDVFSDRQFESDIDKIKRAVNELNYRMNTGMEMYISVNEFYDEIGLKHTQPGDVMGWRIDRGLIDIHYGSMLINDQPYVTIEFLNPPDYDFNKLY